MQVRNNSGRVTRINGIFIRPGINHVSDEHEAAFLKDREFSFGLKSGKGGAPPKFEILGKQATATKTGVTVKKSGPVPGPEMKVVDLLPLIEHMTDPAVLDDLESRDNRSTVRTAIEKQRKAIAPPPFDPDKARKAGMTEEEIQKLAAEE